MILFLKAFIAFIILLSPLSANEIFLKENMNNSQKELKDNVAAEICIRTDERREGRNKICYYDCSGRSEIVKVASTKLCPAAIER